MIDATYVAVIAGMAGQAGVYLFMAGKFKAVVDSIQAWKVEVAPMITAIDKKVENHEVRISGLEGDSWSRHRTR